MECIDNSSYLLTSSVTFSHSFSKGALIFPFGFLAFYKKVSIACDFSKKSTDSIYEVSAERVQIEVIHTLKE